MNIVKLHDIKLIHGNSLHSYTLTMKHEKEKLRTTSFTIAATKIKHLGIT